MKDTVHAFEEHFGGVDFINVEWDPVIIDAHDVTENFLHDWNWNCQVFEADVVNKDPIDEPLLDISGISEIRVLIKSVSDVVDQFCHDFIFS